MTEYTITISEEGDKVLQLAFDTDNAHRPDPFETMDAFLTHQIEQEFGISPEAIEATARKQKVDAIVESLKDVPTEKLSEVATAVDVVAKPVDVKPAPVNEEPLMP